MLTIQNRHIADCGKPPSIDPKDVRWLSYFENADREQSIYVVTKDRKALVYIGDIGWDKPLEIEVVSMSLLATDGPARIILDKRTGKPLTSCQEARWICVCWDMSKEYLKGEG